MTIKKRFGLSTDAATNAQSPVFVVMAAVVSLPDGWHKELLLAGCLVVLGLLAWLNRGDGDVAVVDGNKSLDEVLDDGRK